MNILRIRYLLQPSEHIQFPALAGNTLRGALGVWSRTNDPRLFELCFSADPFRHASVRPFLVRANHLNCSITSVDELFSFALHLFSNRDCLSDRFTKAIKNIFEQGVGVGRGRAELNEVHQTECTLSLDRHEPARKMTVDFLSPTELKFDNLPATSFSFSLLFRRIHGRLQLLARNYGGELTMPEPTALLLLADEITTIHSGLTHVDLRRHSTRTGQTHPTGGMIGSVTYSGSLSSFVPYLRAAELIGVGRQTVWGNGEIAVSILP